MADGMTPDATTPDVKKPTARDLASWLADTCLIGAVSAMVCWVLDSILLGFLANDGYGFLFFIPGAEAAVCVGALVVTAVWLVRSAQDRLGATLMTPRRTAAAVCAVGWLPWFAPDEARMGLSRGLAAGPALVAGTMWFTAVAALAFGTCRMRRPAIVGLAVVTVLWLPVRDAVVGTASDAALDRRSVPRSMALSVAWPGYEPTHYQRSGAEIGLEYDLVVPIPCPDCESVGVLTIAPAAADPCALPLGPGDGQSLGYPADCRQVGSGTWVREDSGAGCEVLQNRGAMTIGVYEDDCPGTPYLLDILETARPADPAEILSRT